MKTKSLNISSDKLLLFGGVYSNLQALEELQKIAEKEGFSHGEVICTGDIVGYCAQPEESVQFIKEWGIHTIIGNVEENLRNGTEDCGCDFDEGTRCDLFSRQWYPYAQEHTSSRSVKWMKTLPQHLSFSFGGKRWMVVHGSYTHISDFIFNSTPWEAKQKQLNLAEVDGIIAGHCGLPFSNLKEGKYWINPGVIGMPANDGRSKVWYALLTHQDGKINVEHKTFAYDHQLTNQLMLENKLPASYANTIITGIWDNCEILPDEETSSQGQEISFEKI